jgi:hypothetical protein
MELETMTKAVPEQKREINQRARTYGGPDPEADLGVSGTPVEDTQSAVRPGDSRNGPLRASVESFLAHPVMRFGQPAECSRSSC